MTVRVQMASRVAAAMLVAWMAWGSPAARAAGADPPPPLSAAQLVLFETPHLANVTRPETLSYRFTQLGPGGFTDQVTMTVAEIHDDGTKDLRFDFLTGDHHVDWPGIARFTANPLLMLFLEYDVRQMRQQTGMAAAYFRERLRQSFLDGATVTEATATVDGAAVPARVIVVRPYASDPHFGQIKVIGGKTYTFVMSPLVPGGIAAIRAEAPADPALGAPALGDTIAFQQVRP
jgi:hypothetical protein